MNKKSKLDVDDLGDAIRGLIAIADKTTEHVQTNIALIKHLNRRIAALEKKVGDE